MLLARQKIPHLRSVNVDYIKPELARECPDTLYDFVTRLGRDLPLLVDNEPFTWEGHEYLIEPYRALSFPGDRKTERSEFVWMCGAQVGKSVGAMLLDLFLAVKFWGKYIGYFLPTNDMAMIFSSERFKPMALGIPDIAKIWGEDPTVDEGDKKGRKADKMRVRSIGPSLIFFNSMSGKTATESIPMLALVFDEVRRMLDADIERARERISHSPYPIEFQISTAGYPEVNIDRTYRASTQNKFHSRCSCHDGVVLSDVFPDCIGEKLPGVTPSLAGLPNRFYICPVCKEPIVNPRDGRWIAHYPDARRVGYHIAQTLSSRQTAESIYRAFIEAFDITEFYNSKLGVPHISKDAQIVTLDILRATVNTDLRWPHVTGDKPVNCAMGVDQMFGFNVVVIRRKGKKDLSTGICKSVLVHLEWIVAADPWQRTAELMREYDVSRCVVDSMPNGNEALRFAREFQGRVWLADYSYEGGQGKDVAVWGDREETEQERKAKEDTKEKYRVRISRYHGLEWNLMRYPNRIKEQPHERGLIRDVPDRTGRMVPTFICEAVFWDHMTRLARRKIDITEKDGQDKIYQGKFKMVFENVGLDPHFAHADLYCELALTRIPDPESAAFYDRRKDVEAKESAKIHEWERLDSDPSHFRCSRCHVTVAVPPESTADTVAAKVGFKVCKPTT